MNSSGMARAVAAAEARPRPPSGRVPPARRAPAQAAIAANTAANQTTNEKTTWMTRPL
ncbi:MAG: hypothetical protein U1E33_07460 [Rhodospirillales bacterium]